MNYHPIKIQGFVELYMAVGLFLILAFGMSLAIEYKMREIKTEKSAWLAQTQSWKKSENNQTLDRNAPEFIELLQKNFHQDSSLRVEKVGLLDREEGMVVSDGLIRSISKAVNLLTTYIKCPDQVEPLSLLVFKHVIYPHGQSKIVKTFNPTFRNDISAFMDVEPMDNHKAMYQDINRTFTGTDIGDTGWFLRQLLWQEAVGKSEFGYLLPLQLLGFFEFSKRIVAILTKDPSIFSFLKRGKIKKAKNLIKKDILGSFIFEALAQKLEEYTEIKPSGKFDSDTCKNLSRANP